MSTINFVPDDYVQQRQSSRANSLYLLLLVAVLAGIGVTFSVLKMRQRAVQSKLMQLNSQMNQARESIAKLEELKEMSNTRMKVMMTTASLLEPVPRSILLASLTNNLPGGVSLTEFKLEEKEQAVKASPSRGSAGDKKGYQKAKTPAKPAAEEAPAVPKTDTQLEIKGIAPSDIEVAGYIANLNASILLNQVQLIQSDECEIEGIKFREFHLKAQLKPEVKLTREDIEAIRKKRNETI